MADLTIIYLTANLLPAKFASYQRGILLEAAGDYPIISVSRKPMEFGYMSLLDAEPKSLSNIYFQMLKAARYTETEFVAVAEDDCFYHTDHFKFHRPKPDTFAYDQNRLALFTWGKPTYHWRNRKSNCSLIAPTKLLIESLEERFTKWPNGTPEDRTGELGRQMVEDNLRITRRKSKEVFCDIAIIQFNHDFGSEERQRNHKKSMGPLRAYDIPYWGKAKDVVSLFYEH